MAEDEMVGWHHQLSGHESEQTLGYNEGQGLQSVGCDFMTEQQQIQVTSRR